MKIKSNIILSKNLRCAEYTIDKYNITCFSIEDIDTTIVIERQGIVIVKTRINETDYDLVEAKCLELLRLV